MRYSHCRMFVGQNLFLTDAVHHHGLLKGHLLLLLQLRLLLKHFLGNLFLNRRIFCHRLPTMRFLQLHHIVTKHTLRENRWMLNRRWFRHGLPCRIQLVLDKAAHKGGGKIFYAQQQDADNDCGSNLNSHQGTVA